MQRESPNKRKSPTENAAPVTADTVFCTRYFVCPAASFSLAANSTPSLYYGLIFGSTHETKSNKSKLKMLKPGVTLCGGGDDKCHPKVATFLDCCHFTRGVKRKASSGNPEFQHSKDTFTRSSPLRVDDSFPVFHAPRLCS